MTDFQNQRLSVNEEGDEKAFIAFAKDIFGFANRNRRHRRSKQNGDDDGDDPEEKNIQSIHHNKVDETTITKLDKDQKTDGEETMTAKDGGGTKPAADNSSVDLLRHLSGIDIENPTLFSETFSMAVASAAIFPLAEVREAARAEKIDAPGIIPLPVKTMTIVQTFVDHKDELKKLLKPADFELMELLYDLLFPASDVIESNGSLLWDIVNDASLHYFGDDDSKSECVYFLLLNPTLNRVLLCFRGSITTKDWIQDSKNVVGKIHNPLFMRSDQGETLGVHLGFREYLYSRSTNASLLNLKADLSVPVLSIAKQISASARSAHSTENRDHAVDDKNDGREESIDENGENYSSAVSSATDQSDQILTPITPSESKQSLTAETSAHPQARCRLEKILDEIDNLRRENRGYRIYVSGHSLGKLCLNLIISAVAVIDFVLWSSLTLSPRCLTRRCIGVIDSSRSRRTLGCPRQSRDVCRDRQSPCCDCWFP